MAGTGTLAQKGGQDSAWSALLQKRDIQFAFPDAQGAAAPPDWLRKLAAFFHRYADWFEYAGWALLVSAILLLGYFLVRHLWRRDWSGGANFPLRPMPAWQPSVEQARLLLQDADALAAKGLFSEAAHMLLLVCVQEIGDRHPGLLMPALTSREIGRLEILSAQARTIFSQIAVVVERCLFGDRAIGAQDFAEVRGAFEQFTVPEAWRARA